MKLQDMQLKMKGHDHDIVVHRWSTYSIWELGHKLYRASVILPRHIHLSQIELDVEI